MPSPRCWRRRGGRHECPPTFRHHVLTRGRGRWHSCLALAPQVRSPALRPRRGGRIRRSIIPARTLEQICGRLSGATRRDRRGARAEMELTVMSDDQPFIDNWPLFEEAYSKFPVLADVVEARLKLARKFNRSLPK